MLYCEKCNILVKCEKCPLCKNMNLREVKDIDFCYFTSIGTIHYEIFKNALKKEKIDIVGIPYYTRPVTLSSAGRAQGRRVYVRYKDFEKAKEIFNMFSGNLIK